MYTEEPQGPGEIFLSYLVFLLFLLLSAAVGAAVGAFFSDKAQPLRRRVFLAVLATVGAVVAIALLVFKSPAAYPIAFFVAAIAAWVALRIIRPRGKKKKDTTFGSAEWADLEHLQKTDVLAGDGFRVGYFPTTSGQNIVDNLVRYNGDRHLLTVAPTRSGKGTCVIVPNLLTYQGSALVIDPKGENAMITAARRGAGSGVRAVAGMGQTVHVVDPWDIATKITGQPSACFNPLDWLQTDDPAISENAFMLADSMVVPTEGGKDRFWDEEAKALLMGLILYVALDPREKETRNLGRVRDIIVADDSTLKATLGQMFESDNPVVKSTAARTASKAPELRANVLASLQSHTHFLDSPRIRASLSRSDFRFEDLKTQAMTVYLVLPADRINSFGRWLRILVQQAITVNARNIEVKPVKPILFLLDEMAALGRLTMVEQAYSLMAGFGMQLWGIVQDLGQLERIYDKGWETFIGNSGVVQYFGSRDNRTAEYFSKLCGVTTVEKFSFTNSIAHAISWARSSFSSGSSSTNTESTTWTDGMTTDVVQRHLATADELMVLRDGKQLLFIESLNPISSLKREWFKTAGLKEFGVDLRAETLPAAPSPASPNGRALEKELA